MDPQNPTAQVSPKSVRTLIVEDSEFDARVLVSELRAGGYQPSWKRVATPDTLSAALDAQAWDLILCDHNMPGFSAPEALRLVQRSGLDIPFLIVSAGIGEDEAVKAMKDGAHDFLIKGKLARLVPAVERELREAEVRSARRKAEESLRQSELRHRLVWENSTDAIVLFDGDGIIRFANPAVVAMFGWDITALLGQSITVLYPAGGEVRSWLETARGDGARRLLDTPGLRRDGVSVDLDVAFSQLRVLEQGMFAAFVRDITERKRFLLELAKSRREFAAAREIQQRLFPKSPPVVPGLEIAGVSHPAEAAGGDYFDYLPLPGGGLGVVVADVSGHGLGPALLMSECRTALRLVAQAEPEPSRILTHTNSVLAEDLAGERYITLLFVRIEPGLRRLVHASAGHPPGLVIDAQGAVKSELRRTGPPLGQRKEFHFKEHPSTPLEVGDTIVLLTDGALEAMQGNVPFGRDRLIETIRLNRHRSAGEIVESICAAVREFCAGEPEADDLTVVVIKVV
jgi:sigma-B regulation protein RsbU (phosphoserine phosphatase)